MKAAKSFLVSPDDPPPPKHEVIEGLTIKERSGGIYLGIGVNRKGVFSIEHVKGKLRQLEGRLNQLLRFGLKIGHLRPDICIAMFLSVSRPVIDHALALADPGSHRVTLLDRAQSKFCKSFLELPDSAPDCVGKSELGMIDFKILTCRSKLMLLHRVISNPLDALTQKMLTWPTDTDGNTFLDECKNCLSLIGYPAPISCFLELKYPAAKLLLNELSLSAR